MWAKQLLESEIVYSFSISFHTVKLESSVYFFQGYLAWPIFSFKAEVFFIFLFHECVGEVRLHAV